MRTAKGLIAASVVPFAVAANWFLVSEHERRLERDWLGRWDSLSTWLVALGTLGLAIATYAVARQAKNEATAVRQQAETAVRPILVEVPIGVYVEREIAQPGSLTTPHEDDRGEIIVDQENESLFVWLPLRNAGSGAALIRDIAMTSTPLTGHLVQVATETSQMLVPPEQIVGFSIDLTYLTGEAGASALVKAKEEPSAANLESHQLVASVTYTDVNGGQGTRTVVFLRYRSRPGLLSPWRVSRLELYEGDHPDPFVTLEPERYRMFSANLRGRITPGSVQEG